eukprot:SM000053S17392  [mRNA]  locus=s53:151617:158299:+ [translate_table: standard]
MYLEDISIDGFKSYARRTTVSGFDPHFNAITGLNGSGKSNILDAICFNLGITNLQHVRAQTLQELVYKQGQAGVTKATVSITFNNADRVSSPVGYEDCRQIIVTRQIVLGGRHKYTINGMAALPSRVQNLFHSVQLNVNNPHFLIMQGRVTKVLNMRPMETLSMLEEAAGTRMYEMKKEGALKMLEKKQAKVDEIQKVLGEEIVPKLESLRKEKSAYMQWRDGVASLENLKRFCIAHEFVEAERASMQAADEAEQVHERVELLKREKVAAEESMADLRERIANLMAEKEKRMGAELAGLVDIVDVLSKDLVKDTSMWSNTNEALAAEQTVLESMTVQQAELQTAVKAKRDAVCRTEEEMESTHREVQTLSDELSRAEQEHQAVLAGKSGAQGDDKSMTDILRELKVAVEGASSEAKQASVRMQYLQAELVARTEALGSKQEEATKLEQELAAVEAAVKRYQTELSALGFDPAHLERLQNVKKEETETVKMLKATVDVVTIETQSNVVYSDPVPGFDRSRVKGTVGRLFSVKETSAMLALEVAAGSKVHNLVTDTAETGKLLFSKAAALKRRVTVLPLDKIEHHQLNERQLAAANTVVGMHNARPALSLIECSSHVKPAMEFVFGSTFICKDIATANKVAFHPDIRATCVTLEGDILQPSGVLTGGSRSKGGSQLRKLAELSQAERDLCDHQQVLEQTGNELNRLESIKKEHKRLEADLGLKVHQLSLLKERVAQSGYHQLLEEVKSLEVELTLVKKELREAEERRDACQDRVTSWERKLVEHGKHRERRLQSIQVLLRSTNERLGHATREAKAKEQAKQELLLEADALKRELQVLEDQIISTQLQASKLAEKVAVLAAQVARKKAEHDIAQETLDEKKARLEECDLDIATMSREQERHREQLTSIKLSLKAGEHQIKRINAKQHEAAKLVDMLLEKHMWIRAERDQFRRTGSAYDFEAQDPEDAHRALLLQQNQLSSLEKTINKKVMVMMEQAEEEYCKLIQKREIVKTDKTKIQQVIAELDDKKRKALLVTWQKVNKDFGSIFSTLLPGTSAKLDPAGASFLEGLEVKVAFGGVWKQSLSELSGGQRSLLALSLILSLLLFKPAPLYILDEVDAALDLSHTQNIGRMIKMYFPQSQFIVVSLKEGMFNNANVVFRTKFVDGISTVTRTVQQQLEGHEAGKEIPIKAASKKALYSQ